MIQKTIFTISLLSILCLWNIAAQTPKNAAKITKGVVNGAAIALPKPIYPAAAQAVKASGAVNVRVTIDEQGNVTEATAISGHPLLRQAAEQAAREAKFKPTTLKGQAVKVSGVIVYNFVPSNTTDERFVWALSFFLNFIRDTEIILLHEIYPEKELDDLLTEMAKDIPEEFAAEKELFDRMAKSKGVERQRAAAELSNSFKKHFTSEEIVEYEIGEAMAGILGQIARKGFSMAGGNIQSNEAILKENLVKLRDLLKKPTTNIPPETIKQLKAVAAFADTSDLNSEEAIRQLFLAIEPIMESFDTEE